MNAKYFVVNIIYRGKNIASPTMDSFDKLIKVYRVLLVECADSHGDTTVELCFSYVGDLKNHCFKSFKCDNRYNTQSVIQRVLESL